MCHSIARESLLSLARILLVDDHATVRKSTFAGPVVVPVELDRLPEAADGYEAVEKAKQLRPEIVLMDISMPRMDGLQATHLILENNPECAVIIVTQNEECIARRQAAIVDAKGFVNKADLHQSLVATVEKVVANASLPTPGQHPQEKAAAPEDWVGGGELGELVREFDWSKTPLGEIRWMATKFENGRSRSSDLPFRDVDGVGAGTHFFL